MLMCLVQIERAPGEARDVGHGLVGGLCSNYGGGYCPGVLETRIVNLEPGGEPSGAWRRCSKGRLAGLLRRASVGWQGPEVGQQPVTEDARAQDHRTRRRRGGYGGAKEALAKLYALAAALVNDYGMLRSPKSCRSRPGRVTFTDTFRPAGSGRS